MSERLPGLESAGYVERATSGRGRPAPVHLTDAGRDVLARATPLVEEADRAEALGLDPRRADHSRASLVGKRTRQPLVFAHVVVSLGRMGAGAANVVLTSTAAVTDDVELRRACYLLVSTIDRWHVIPGAFLALATGVVLSLVTPWGLVTYWWVLVKLALTVGVIPYSTFFVGAWVEESVAVGISPSPVAVPLVIGPLVSMAAFLLTTWASVAKPWGRTPWRRRRARERVLAAA